MRQKSYLFLIIFKLGFEVEVILFLADTVFAPFLLFLEDWIF